MDCYSGMKFEELLVPNYQELSSANRWMIFSWSGGDVHRASSSNFAGSEELVLQDLQRASGKLTDETRKCFRDTFNRLARNSQEKFDSVNTNSEEFYTQAPIYGYGNSTGMSREEEIESETNSI